MKKANILAQRLPRYFQFEQNLMISFWTEFRILRIHDFSLVKVDGARLGRLPTFKRNFGTLKTKFRHASDNKIHKQDWFQRCESSD